MRSRPSGFITGKETEINWRATRLHTKADEIVIIPNSEMARMRFINFSIPEKHYRAEVQVSLSHTIPGERVKRILLAALKSTPGVMMDPAPKITLLRFDQRGVLWCVRFWTGAPGSVDRSRTDRKECFHLVGDTYRGTIGVRR